MHKTQLVVLSVLSLVVASALALVGSSPASAEPAVSPSADAYVDSLHPRANRGTLKSMAVDARDARTGDVNSYLRFDLSGYAGRTLQSAALSVSMASASSSGSRARQSVRVVANDSWTERGITYRSAPAMGPTVGTLGPTRYNRRYTVSLSAPDLQAHVGSMLSLAIDTTSRDAIAMRTRETAADPSLTLTFAAAPDTVYSSPSSFGLVRAGISDTSAGWLKTLYTGKALSGTTVDQAAWRGYVQKAWQYKQVEVPLVSDAVWKSGDVANIKTVMRQFFEADPMVPVWEVGREENLSRTWEAELPVTARKLAAVEEVKNSVNPDIKLAYQIVNRASSVEAFLKSDASNHVDILSLHLYRWPDFQDLEPWLEPLLTAVKALEDKYDKHLEIWVTEAGAPTNEAGVPLHSSTRPVSGLSLQGQADYLAKMYATTLNNGVHNFLWYSLRDDRFDPKVDGPATCEVSNVECHFGIKFSDDTPKPAYKTFTTLAERIGTKTHAGWRVVGNTRISTFRSATEEVDVVWNYPAASSSLPLSTFRATSANTRQSTNTGTPMAVSGESVRVTGSPTIVTIDRSSPTPTTTVSRALAFLP